MAFKAVVATEDTIMQLAEALWFAEIRQIMSTSDLCFTAFKKHLTEEKRVQQYFFYDVYKRVHAMNNLLGMMPLDLFQNVLWTFKGVCSCFQEKFKKTRLFQQRLDSLREFNMQLAIDQVVHEEEELEDLARSMAATPEEETLYLQSLGMIEDDDNPGHLRCNFFQRTEAMIRQRLRSIELEQEQIGRDEEQLEVISRSLAAMSEDPGVLNPDGIVINQATLNRIESTHMNNDHLHRDENSDRRLISEAALDRFRTAHMNNEPIQRDEFFTLLHRAAGVIDDDFEMAIVSEDDQAVDEDDSETTTSSAQS